MSVEVTRLPSGLTVVTDAMPHLETASLGVWVGSGSRDEQPDEHGISHLLEHMAFKGTKRRTARQIAEEIEAVGGDLNAATSVETTAYYARVLKADVPLALDVLSDILADPTFDPDELKREQNVIVQEIGAAEDTPDDIVFDYLQANAFPDQPIGRSILGTPETVRSFEPSQPARLSRAQLSRARHGGRGGRRGRSRRGRGTRSSGASPASPGRPRRCRSRRVSAAARISRARDLEQVHIALALEGLPQRDPELYSLQVFTNVLGGGMSSRLFQEVRENRGLCYSIYAFHVAYPDTGMFALYAGTDATDAPELMRVVVDEIAQAAEDLTEAEVARAKAQMKAGLLMALESSRRARRATGAPDDGLWPADAVERDRRQDRSRDGRKRARGWPRADRRQPARGRGARSRAGLERAAKIAESLHRQAA